MKKGVVYIMGDFNARIQGKQDETETPIGPHTFDNLSIRLERQSDGAVDNRSRFLAYCANHDLKMMNTFFDKPDCKLLTYEEPGTKGPPYNRYRYETLDYILTSNRWKNIVTDCEADIDADVDTRHKPVWATIRIKFKH